MTDHEQPGPPARPRLVLFVAALAACAVVRAPLAAEPTLLLEATGGNAGDWLGWYAAPAGDLDGDGRTDFAVGAPRGDGAVAGAGQVRVYLGGPGLDPVPALVLSGEANGDLFGTAVCGCGDVDGDGWDDLVVGAPRNDAAATNAGRVYVYFGGPDLDDQPDLVVDGPTDFAQFGYSVADAGDLDGSGGAVIVGAPGGTASAGRAYVYLGGAGLDDSPDLVLGAGIGGYFGWSVDRAGDFDGDGWDDVMVGGNTLGNVYLFRGGPDLDDQPDLLFLGDSTSNRFGYCVGHAGDLNGDGWDDVAVGDMHNGAGGTYAGRTHVYFGGPGADGAADIVYTGTRAYGIFGRAVAGGCDLNHDGLDDLVIGAPTPDVGGYGPGQAFVFFGGDTVGTSRPDTLADVVLTGEAESDRFGSQVGLVSDAVGDGRAGFLVGANLFDAGGLADAGKFYLYGIPDLAPVAVADSVALPDGQTAFLDVLANDFDPDGTLVPASLAVATAPAHGLAAVDTVAGGLLYTPDPGFAGLDSLAYTVADDEGAVSPPATVRITVPDVVGPAPVALLAAAGAAGAVTVRWEGVPVDADSVEVWRAVWADSTGASAYPLYDDAAGSAPPVRPADRAAALADSAWAPVARLAAADTVLVDSLAVRGDYHYEIFARDGSGNWSGPTAAGARALDYRLGDVAAFGDGVVDSADVAVLAAGFGAVRADSTFVPGLDVGPTADGTPTGVPVTDGVIDFEDAMIVGMNHGVPAAPPASGSDVLVAWRRPAPETWVLDLEEAHPSLKGLAVSLDLPAGVTVQVGGGDALAGQTAPVFLANAAPDTLAASCVALGGGETLIGTGRLLVITLSAPAELPEPAVTARATDNSDLAVAFAPVSGVPGARAPAFALAQNHPNPFNPHTSVAFTVATAGRVRLTVYDVRGRRVATLVDRVLAAGPHEATWDGTDDRGARVGSGVYLYRLESGGRAAHRRMTLVK